MDHCWKREYELTACVHRGWWLSIRRGGLFLPAGAGEREGYNSRKEASCSPPGHYYIHTVSPYDLVTNSCTEHVAAFLPINFIIANASSCCCLVRRWKETKQGHQFSSGYDSGYSGSSIHMVMAYKMEE